MRVGVVTRSFPEMTNREAAEFMSANDLLDTELTFFQKDSKFWVYNGRSDMTEMTDQRSKQVVDEYRSRGIAVHVLGVFTNLLEPDADELQANLQYFERHMQIAAFNKIPVVATECGFVPGRRGVQLETYESAFEGLVETFQWLTERAEHYGVKIALEACVLDVVPSAKRARDFLDQVGSNRAGVLLDPANLIANSSEEDMFRYLADRILYLHGKDRKLNDAKGRVVGDGDIDWPLFMRLYHEHAEGLPFILEYVNKDNVCEIRDRVLAADQAS
jgi:sugar phosphate isomerase/epimerase